MGVEPHIQTLLAPKTTVMDLNIATALWFASRGLSVEEQKRREKELLQEHEAQLSRNTNVQADDPNEAVTNNNEEVRNHRKNPETWNSPRVLLLGMGADEQMGG